MGAVVACGSRESASDENSDKTRTNVFASSALCCTYAARGAEFRCVGARCTFVLYIGFGLVVAPTVFHDKGC